jgi:hypothetical protein
MLQVKVHIAPSSIDEFWSAFRPIYDIVLAEPELLYFVIGTGVPAPEADPSAPVVLSWTEGWSKDVNWLVNVQLKKEYYKPYLERTEKMFVKERKCACFLMSCVTVVWEWV